MEKIITLEDLESIPYDHLPLMVLSTDNASFFSWGVRARRHANYSHFMWMHRAGFFASQHFFFKEVPVSKFFEKTDRLKFWTCSLMTEKTKQLVFARIQAELDKPKWKTRYDWLAILGQLLGISQIQNPWTKICSEHAAYIKYFDPRYNLKCPAPDQVNEWMKYRSEYTVYGRYYND